MTITYISNTMEYMYDKGFDNERVNGYINAL